MGKALLKLGPRVQLLRSRKCVSKAGLISHWSSSLGNCSMLGMQAATLPVSGCGVAGPCGEPAFTCVEKGEDAEMDDVVERVEDRTIEAGSRQSRCS